jgi:hypothetical protein
MAAAEDHSPEGEHKNHRYVGNEIPWYIHLWWLSFWIFAVVYSLVYALPAIQKELLSPP